MEKNSVSIPSLQQEQTTNVLNKDVATNQKIIKSEIDLLNASIRLQASEITTVKESVVNVSNKIDETESSLSQVIQDTEDTLNQTIQDTEDTLNQNIQDTANQINQDVINQLKDYAKVEDLDDYVTTEKLESTIDLTTESIMQSVTQEITTTKSEISQEIATSISESEAQTNQTINSTKNELNQTIQDTEDSLNDNINNAVSGLEQEITTTLTHYVTTETFNSSMELQSDSILQSVSEDIETVQTNITANTNTAINNLNSQINDTLNDYATTTMVTNIKNSVENEITSTQQSINVINQVLEDGVTKVDTKTGFTFDQTGLTIAKTNAKTKTNLNENGMIIYSSTGSVDNPMLDVNSTGVTGENMTVRTYLTVGSHSRFEDYQSGTGCFYLE